MSYTVTQDFREEYEAERTRWLRTRFLWYSGVLGAFATFNLLLSYLAVAIGPQPNMQPGGLVLISANGLPQVILFIASFMYAYRRPLPQQTVLSMVFWLTVISGTIGVVTAPFFQQMGMRATGAVLSDDLLIWGRRMSALSVVFVTHFIASLFIPWTPRESLRPLVPLLLALAIVTFAFDRGTWVARIVFLAFAPVVGVPGILVCLWRHSRFRTRFHLRMLRGRYGELQRELVDARIVHEELFPQPIDTGPIRLHYRYEPMRQIGGDYLYAHRAVDEGGQLSALHVVLVDVTGHGIKAALTVNRIYGELERIFAETPDISPGDLLLGLNRYVRLTLSKHNVYATALAMRFDLPADTLAYANAGHPPAFLRTAGGLIDQLDSTAPLLGVFPREHYDPHEQTIRFGLGDTMIAYTDGVTDTANDQGARFRIEGVQRILAADRAESDRKGRWTGTLASEIERFRFGPMVDDTLLVEVWRPVRPDEPPTPRSRRTRRGDTTIITGSKVS